ncbi:acyltransferase family protein [Candidatus Gottesmanbacteria bacterium]|nr:acyltransferase family protein [Candidatus Gottesmanbacteria bacterium]
MSSKRQNWIDALKGIAICAVVLGHSWDIFSEYKIPFIWKHLVFTIPWFIFLAGITNGSSYDRKKDSLFSFYSKRSRLFIDYIFAALTAYFLLTPQADLTKLTSLLFNFTLQPTFYFVNLILQLYIIFPFLYFISRKGKILPFLSVPVVFVISFWLLWEMGMPPWPFSSAGRLFGAGYLFIFYLGILYSRIKPGKFILLFLSFVFIAAEIRYMILPSFPPEISPTFFSFTWSILFIFPFILIFRSKMRLFPLEFLGRHALYIYLYHYLILLLSRKYLASFPYIIILVLSFLLPLSISAIRNKVARGVIYYL